MKTVLFEPESIASLMSTSVRPGGKCEEIAKEVLENLEKEMRDKINALAEKRDYSAITFGEGREMGQSLRSGLNHRWMNVLRILAMGDFGLIHLQRELDMETIRAIHKALP